MKFGFKSLFVALVFILGLSVVCAKEVETDEIDINTYVIGTHMFTRETNENYDGQLTIKLIMLAAKTIPGDSLDDMVIYYKNARGKWIDGVSGEMLNVPDSFEIEYTDTKLEMTIFYGDVDFNGKVTNADVLLISRYIDGLEELDEKQLNASDINQDGEVDHVDVDILSKYIVDKEGYEIELPYDSGEKYTITYNLDGGTIKNEYRKYSAITLSYGGYILKKPTKEGYTFVGWTGSNGNTPEINVTIEEGTTGDLTYTANWQENNM